MAARLAAPSAEKGGNTGKAEYVNKRLVAVPQGCVFHTCVAFRHDASRRDFDNMQVFCGNVYLTITMRLSHAPSEPIFNINIKHR